MHRGAPSSRQAAAVLSLTMLSSCQRHPSGLEDLPIPVAIGRARRAHYELRSVPAGARWFQGRPPFDRSNASLDEDGVVLFEREGRSFYHPVQIIHAALDLLDEYVRTGDANLLLAARAHAARLSAEAVSIEGGDYYAFRFDFPLHGLSTDVMRAPWFSAMAQGEALILFSRLFDVTKDPAFLEGARRAFQSFVRLGTSSKSVATVSVDADGYYWLDEYPMAGQHNRVLNGFVFAVYGLYEYHELLLRRQDRGASVARSLVLASLATLRRYAGEFRTPGGRSVYCLQHRVQDARYHKVHVQQLRDLYRISGDEFFWTPADQLAADSPP
ncbi:MAG: hypothetical protein HYV07_02770 [Deltaproteobacteria bacterium]|nr:hypothetical protein [Deltaproteobacteria bacterium]